MKKIVKKEIELPFEIGQIYVTRFQTGEMFKLTNIEYRKKDNSILCFYGIYQNSIGLGICLLNPDRLIPKSIVEEVEENVCEHCGKVLKLNE